MSERRRVGRPANHPKVLNLNTGQIHETYASAERELKERGVKSAHRSKVMMVCHGVQTHHHGYRFKFVK